MVSVLWMRIRKHSTRAIEAPPVKGSKNFIGIIFQIRPNIMPMQANTITYSRKLAFDLRPDRIPFKSIYFQLRFGFYLAKPALVMS